MKDSEQDIGIDWQATKGDPQSKADILKPLPIPATQKEFSAQFSDYGDIPKSFYPTSLYAVPSETGQAEVVSEVKKQAVPGAVVAIGLSGLLVRDCVDNCGLLLIVDINPAIIDLVMPVITKIPKLKAGEDRFGFLEMATGVDFEVFKNHPELASFENIRSYAKYLMFNERDEHFAQLDEQVYRTTKSQVWLLRDRERILTIERARGKKREKEELLEPVFHAYLDLSQAKSKPTRPATIPVTIREVEDLWKYYLGELINPIIFSPEYKHFLSSEEEYQSYRALCLADQLRGIVGDITNPATLAKIAEILKAFNLSLSVIHTGNAVGWKDYRKRVLLDTRLTPEEKAELTERILSQQASCRQAVRDNLPLTRTPVLHIFADPDYRLTWSPIETRKNHSHS